MSATCQTSMIRLEDSDLRLGQPLDDVRGMTVVDPHFHRVGDVDDLIVDGEQRRARLLVVASGGILGLVRTRRLVPVDAVTRVDDRVHIELSHEQVHRCVEFDPAPATLVTHDEVYSHYGYLPFWGPDYAPPYFLRRE